MKNNSKYNFDVSVARVRSFVKRQLPVIIQERINRHKRKSSGDIFEQLLFHNNPPWSSPNIWETIVDHYKKVNHPIIFEYGTGSSSLWHFENLFSTGGEYFGVEIDQNWFWVVLSALLKRATDHSIHLTLSIQTDKDSNAINACIKTSNAIDNLMFGDNEADYVKAFNMMCNVVIVDGAHRKPCITYVLDSNYLVDGGLLMLMEAGRGSDNWWQGKLSSTLDYSKELERMLLLGGEILDGNGIDNWPKTSRKSINPVSYCYPMEACKLIVDRTLK